MSNKHTPEPLEVVTVLEGTFIAVDGGGFIARMEDNGWGDPAKHARRIVACVNACRGLPTDELEQKGLVAAVGSELLERDALVAKLLDALSGLVDFVQIDGLPMDELALKIAKDAVAAARGAQ